MSLTGLLAQPLASCIDGRICESRNSVPVFGVEALPERFGFFAKGAAVDTWCSASARYLCKRLAARTE
jgi:hypothetical protein